MEEEDLELQVQHHLVETLLTLSSKKKTSSSLDAF